MAVQSTKIGQFGDKMRYLPNRQYLFKSLSAPYHQGREEKGSRKEAYDKRKMKQ